LRNYTDNAKENLLAVSADEPFLILLEIMHPDLEVPIRIVNDVEAVISRDQEFIGMPFNVTLPDDIRSQIPYAVLEVDNIGRELTTWLEYSRGGQHAKCRLMQILKSDPDQVELDITMDLTEMVITNSTVKAKIGFVNVLGQSAVTTTFTPRSAPGLW